MRKLLIFTIITASAILTGCSTSGEEKSNFSKIADIIPNALDRTSLIYRPTIQQGNVVTQDQVNKLKPGMSKRQAEFILGSSMLRDVFHNNRWDYTFTTGVGSKPSKITHFSIFFDENRLVRTSGDLHPQPEGEQDKVEAKQVVSVPDWTPKEKSFFSKVISTASFGKLESKEE